MLRGRTRTNARSASDRRCIRDHRSYYPVDPFLPECRANIYHVIAGAYSFLGIGSSEPAKPFVVIESLAPAHLSLRRGLLRLHQFTLKPNPSWHSGSRPGLAGTVLPARHSDNLALRKLREIAVVQYLLTVNHHIGQLAHINAVTTRRSFRDLVYMRLSYAKPMSN